MNAARICRQYRRRHRNDGVNAILRLLVVGLATVVMLTSFVLGTGAATVAGVYYYFAKDLPPAEEIGVRALENFETTRIYDRTGKHVLYEILDPQGGHRTMVPLQRIPQYLRDATIALEERDFYENPLGVNFRGIFRAAINNLMGKPIQGGSSIAQQLVRNVVMSPEERFKRSYARKIKEVILAYELSRRYPGYEGKDKILEWYLNTVYYGQLAYGVQAAAETYFGKNVEDLTLAESAMLAALPQYPALNPIDNPVEAKKRQAVVLDQMYLQGYITAEEAWEAKQEPLYIAPPRYNILAPHFVMYVRKQLVDKYGPEAVYGGGLQVYTTLDLDLQNEAQRIAREHIAKLRDEHHVTNAAVVVIRPETGEILAMVGSLDYYDETIDGQVNVATAPRQPGSSFKPFTYATAFSKGYTPATMIMDVRTSFPDPPNPPYVPENYTRKFYGPVLLRRALAWSLNVPAVALMHQVGIEDVLDTAHRMGINTLTKPSYGLSLTLGGGEVTLLDMTYAFSVFANNGTMAGEPIPLDKLRPGFRQLDPVCILRVEDSQGNVIDEFKGPERREVLRPQVAYLINDILSDNNARAGMFGINSPLAFDRPVAAKTGSTTNYRDAWTIGYTPQVAVGVWVGNSDNSEMEHLPGVRGAGPIFHAVMEYLLASLPVVEFPRPPDIVEVEVDATSGLLPTEYSPSRIKEIFIRGTEPTTYDNIHRPFRICKASGKLATVYCPPDQTEEVVFEIYPPEAADWVRATGKPQPPTEYCDVHGPNVAASDVAIISPTLYSYVRGVVPVIGNARAHRFRLFRLQYGEGMDPSSWTQIGGERYDQVSNSVLGYWDATQLDGLYSLKLTVVDKDNNYQETAVQVSVDNISPTVRIIYPDDGALYRMETDEWINIQVDAEDNTAMDRVEFYLDGRKLDYTTVVPYTQRWTIVMSDTLPAPISWSNIGTAGTQVIVEGDKITARELVTSELELRYTETITVGEQVTVTQWISREGSTTVIQSFPDGRTIISDTRGYTETHTIYVVAVDAAGNRMESEKITVYIMHEEKEEEEQSASPTAMLLPERYAMLPPKDEWRGRLP